MEILKVSSKSNPNKVAGAVANIIKNKQELEIQTIGAGALNQAIKSIVIARGYLVPVGIDILCIPSFSDITINDVNKTAIKLLLEVK